MGAAISDLPSFVSRERAVRRLQEMVRIPAVTGEEQPMAVYVAAALREVGCSTVHVDDHWNVLGIMGEGRGPSVMLLTHTDAAPVGAMQDPYSGAIMDGTRFGKPGPVVYGRGACAPKSAIAAMLEALAALRDGGIRLTGSIQVAAVTKDLRANHEGLKELAASYPVKADFMIAGEPSDNHVVLGARGIGHYEVRFTGKAAHWGRPAEAVNPLYGVAELLLALEKMTLPRHPVLGEATVSPFEVHVEATPPRSPHAAAVTFDRRLLPEESVEAVRGQFQRLVDGVLRGRPGLQGEVVYVKGMYPYAVPETAPTVTLLQRAAEVVLRRRLPTTYITFSSNASYAMRELKIDGAAFGPGRIGDVTETEHVAIDSLYEAAVVYAAAGALAAA